MTPKLEGGCFGDPSEARDLTTNELSGKMQEIKLETGRHIESLLGEWGEASDLAAKNAMDLCQICGLLNQVGKSFNKRVGLLTSPVGRCTCDFCGFQNAQRAKDQMTKLNTTPPVVTAEEMMAKGGGAICISSKKSSQHPSRYQRGTANSRRKSNISPWTEKRIYRK